MDPDSRPVPATPAGTATLPSPTGVTVIVDDPAWRRLVPAIERRIGRAARAADESAATILLTSDREVRRLNRDFRGKDKPTNVLTFDSGDLALASGTVRREARAAHRPVANHLLHLVVHGILHLRGHDHGHAGEARAMEMAEARLLRRIGVPNPWKGAQPRPGKGAAP